MPSEPKKMPTFHGSSSGRQTVTDAHMTSSEAHKELARPENQKMLQQFMKNPEGQVNSSAFRAGWERAFSDQKTCPNGGDYKAGEFDVCRCETCIAVENGEK